MATPRVKVFFAYSHSQVGEELQAWLEETAGQIQITGISMDSNKHGHCLTVLYQPGPGPAYDGQVFFAWSHGAVESEANEALEHASDGEPAFIAVGSNEHGHCLCIILAR